MMNQYGQWEMSAEDRQRQLVLMQHAQMRNNPLNVFASAGMVKTIPSGPYESSSMNAKLFAAKKYLHRG